MAQQASITVMQFFDYDTAKEAYRVKQAINTTRPQIGDKLEEADVKALIDAGTKVTITGPS